MKKLLIGAVLGMVTATALCSSGTNKCMKRVKRAVRNGLTDMLD